MALTHADQLLRATARAAFWQNFESFPSITDGIALRVPSDADQETYPWLAYAPGVREMGATRLKRSVPELSWTIVNKKFENTVVVDYQTRKYAKLGAVAAMLGSLGQKAKAYPDKLCSTLINNGHSTACYDTQYFFDTDHSDPGASYTTSQDNDLTSNATDGANPTDIEFAAATRDCINHLYSYKDGDGDPVMPQPNARIIVMVHPNFKSVAERVMKVDQLTGPVGNDLKGSYEVVVNPWLTAPAAGGGVFFVFNASGARKAFIHQVAEDVYLEDDMGGESDFNTKDVSFGSFGFYNEGYGDWRYGVRYQFT